MGLRAGLDGRKISFLPGFDPGTVQSVAQSLYRLSYRSTYVWVYSRELTKKNTSETSQFDKWLSTLLRVSTAKEKLLGSLYENTLTFWRRNYFFNFSTSYI